MNLTFYTHPMSRGRIARWMLEETGLPYEEVLLDYASTMKAPEYLAINPMGKVPALRHGDTVVTESVAIGLYLADLVPEKRLAPPPGSAERGPYYRWLLFLAGPLEALLTAKHAGALASPTSAGYGAEGDVVRVLEQAVAGKTHLAGDRFTAADLYMTAYLNFYMQFGMLDRLPAFETFCAHHAERPAALKALARDEALMAAQQAGR
ncbi:MAG TPA: glutathione S-transferase family protein [Chiayiivirga sp.]|jgi:glutathione S-transferase|nr:glutathione S-transferase family protein [Xanthomonadaceae bacterium]HMN35985.1 glutathione S-transferase family protein [Chiayiivirga sp.]